MPQTQPISRRPSSTASRRAALGTSQKRISELSASLAWGAAGFVLGALCWHVIGFWSFVGDVVLKGPEDRPAIEVAAAPAAAPHSAKPVSPIRATMAGVRGRPKADPTACSEVASTSGSVETRNCPSGLPLIADRPVLARADKLEPLASETPSAGRELMTQRHAAPAASSTPPWSTTIAAPQR